MIELILQAERALTTGMVDQAERLYRQAIDNDPRNSIAVVGLARVAIERGDDREAYRLGRRALEIDGENVAAQRLVARLTEVMAFRGETPPDDPAAGPGPGPATPGDPPRAVDPVSVAAAAAVDAPPPDAQKRGFLDRLRGRG